MTLLLLLLLSITASTASASSSSSGLVVNTQQGQVSGFNNGSVDVWLGVPYAQPPVNELRFHMPQPPLSWQGVLQTTAYSNVCMQSSIAAADFRGYTFPANTTMSEDCLYLNVWRPVNTTPQSRLNVLVWIHGGAFSSGSGTEMRLNGKHMSEMGQMIVVTINYRLGVFGFLGLEETLKTDGTTGNYGLQDQRAALQWVRANIANFGGDPAKVTIAGESAGASSVSYHLVMKRSFGLYANAIAESSAAFGEIWNITNCLTAGAVVQAALQCNDVACMRNVSAATLLQVQEANATSTTACIDGYEFTENPFHSFANGAFNHVPVMAGNVRNEGTAFVYPNHLEPVPKSEYAAMLKAMYPLLSPAQLDTVQNVLYPCTDPSDCRPQMAATGGDSGLFCPTMIMGEYIANTASVPVYSYIFDHLASYSYFPKILGAYHSSEIPFVFSNIDIYGAGATPAEYTLAHNMTNSWVEFAKTNHVSAWPVFDSSTNWNREILNTTLSTETNARFTECQFWASIYKQYF